MRLLSLLRSSLTVLHLFIIAAILQTTFCEHCPNALGTDELSVLLFCRGMGQGAILLLSNATLSISAAMTCLFDNVVMCEDLLKLGPETPATARELVRYESMKV